MEDRKVCPFIFVLGGEDRLTMRVMVGLFLLVLGMKRRRDVGHVLFDSAVTST